MFDLKQRYPEFKKRPVSAIYMDNTDRIWFCIDQQIVLYDVHKKHSYKSKHPFNGKITCITQVNDTESDGHVDVKRPTWLNCGWLRSDTCSYKP